jgi:hypothetical protein
MASQPWKFLQLVTSLLCTYPTGQISEKDASVHLVPAFYWLPYALVETSRVTISGATSAQVPWLRQAKPTATKARSGEPGSTPLPGSGIALQAVVAWKCTQCAALN